MQHSVKWLSNIWIDGCIVAIYIDVDLGIYIDIYRYRLMQDIFFTRI